MLEWDRTVSGTFSPASHSGGTVTVGVPGSPGTKLLDLPAGVLNDSVLPLSITPMFHHGMKLMQVNDPVQLLLNEYWAHSVSVNPPSWPTVNTATPQARFGGGSDSTEGCVWHHVSEDWVTYMPLGKVTVQPGETLLVKYEMWVASQGSGTVANQWVTTGSHTIWFIVDLMKDPAV